MTFIRPNLLGPQLPPRFQKPGNGDNGDNVDNGNNNSNNNNNTGNGAPVTDEKSPKIPTDTLLVLKGVKLAKPTVILTANSEFNFTTKTEFEKYRDAVGFKPGDEIHVYNESSKRWDTYMINNAGEMVRVVKANDMTTSNTQTIFFDTFEELDKAIEAGVLKKGDRIYVKHESKEKTYYIMQLSCNEDGVVTGAITSVGATITTNY